MCKNYLKIAIRNLIKKKGFSFINIFGLAVGMASAMLILLWIQNEVSFDRFHEKTDRIYQVYHRTNANGKKTSWPINAQPLADALSDNYPEVEQAARTFDANFLMSVGDKHLNVHGNFTDNGFLNIFSFPAIYGDIETALKEPHTIVITRKLAVKLFGKEDALGREMRIDSVDRFKVTAVIADLPNNTKFSAEYFLPWSYLKQLKKNNEEWGSASVFTYVLLKQTADPTIANARIKHITDAHDEHKGIETFLYPASKWHLYNKFENGVPAGGRIESVRLFGIIAGFILLIACINFMNLSTARSEQRSKEVGIRKVSGALKSSLIHSSLSSLP